MLIKSIVRVSIILAVAVIAVVINQKIGARCNHQVEIDHLKKELRECNSDIKKAERLINDSKVIIVIDNTKQRMQ